MLEMDKDRQAALSASDPLWEQAASIRVLVADGQLMFAEALALTLSTRQGLSILEEHPTSESEAVELAAALRPDVVLLDLWIPVMGGVAATRAIISRAAHTKVLILSWEHNPIRIREALEAGAAGYLPKSLTSDQVEEAIRRAQAGDWPVFKNELERLLEDLENRQLASNEAAARLAKLTTREIQVLGLLAVGIPKEEVARKLGISKGTVTRHIHKILTKTGSRTHSEAIAIARSADILGPDAAGGS